VDADDTLAAIAFDVAPHNREGSPFVATEGFDINSQLGDQNG